MALTVKLKGISGLRNRVGAYAKAVRREVRLTVEATAKDVQRDARAEAPVDTGALRNSIRTDFQALDRLYAQVYTELQYARRQEYGFTGRDALGRYYDQAGSFFMTKAENRNRGPFEASVRDAVTRARKAAFE